MILDLMNTNIKNNPGTPSVFKFMINTQIFEINYEISDIIEGNFPHVGASARQGILVLYKLPHQKSWYVVEAYHRSNKESINMTHLVKENEKYEVMIYGPILSKLNKLSVEVPEDSYCEIIEPENESILVAGGLNSFGIGCTTVGTMFSSIIGREFNSNIYNLTYNSPNYLDKLYNFLKEDNDIPKCTYGILELDCFNQKDENIELHLKNVIKLIRDKCGCLICWFTIPKQKEYKKDKIYETIDEYISDRNIIVLDLSYIHNNPEYTDMCTYSPNFINDTGNIIIYKKVSNIMRRL